MVAESKQRQKSLYETDYNFRQEIKYQLEDSPSLKPYLKEIFDQSYQDAKVIASEKSGLPLHYCFPEKSIAPLEQVLDESWCKPYLFLNQLENLAEAVENDFRIA